MSVRAVRWSLAAIPVLVMSQCVPQCAQPGSPSPTIPTTTVEATSPPTSAPPTPTPPPPTAVSTTSVVVRPPVAPPTVSRLGHVLQDGWRAGSVTRDGRYVFLSNLPDLQRLDLTTETFLTVAVVGTPTDDGSTVIHLDDDAAITSTNVLTDAAVSYEPIGVDGDRIDGITGISGDGGAIAVRTSGDDVSGPSVFLLDAASGIYTRPQDEPDDPGAHDAASNLLVSGDGWTSVFDVRDDAADGCPTCTSVVARTSAGLRLVSGTVAGTVSTTGSSIGLDVSADGRYVLFTSDATDLDGGPGHADGRLYVRDLLTATTVQVPVEASSRALGAASISDDGQRVAFAAAPDAALTGVDAPPAQPALYDRASGATVVLIDEPDLALAPDGLLGISGDGRRVVFTMTDAGGTVRTYWADLTA